MYATLFSWTHVEHFFGIFSSKLDSPVIKTLESIRFSSNQNIGQGESNFDEKMLKKCSTCVQLNRVAYILELLVTKLVL